MNDSDDLFKTTSGPRNADIAIVGESWGAEERRLGQPFVGSSGQELDRMLAEAGVERSSCFVTNILPEQPPNNKMARFFGKKGGTFAEYMNLWPAPNVVRGVQNVQKQLEIVQPKIIIGTGNYSLWCLTGKNSIGIADTEDGGGKIPTGILNWRGSMLRSRLMFGNLPVLPVVHPAAVLRDWALRPLFVHDVRERVPMALTDRWNGPLKTIIAQPTLQELIEFLDADLQELDRGVQLDRVLDIETKRRNIVCLGVATSRSHAIVIPFCKLDQDRKLVSWWSFTDELSLAQRLRRYLRHPNLRIIGQNFLYDMQYLSRWLCCPDIRCHFDTMLAQHALFPGTPKALDYLSSLYCEHHTFWKNESQEWDEHGTIEQLLYYNAEDVWRTYEIYESQLKMLDNMALWEQFKFLMAEVDMCFDCMKRGVNIDKAARTKFYLEVMDAASARYRWFDRIIPQSLIPTKSKKKWYTSSHQQRQLFYDILGLRVQRHRKTKQPTVDDEALNALKGLYPILSQVFTRLSELRSLGVFANTFLNAPLDPDDRMRSSFNPGGTETYRLSSSTNAFWRGTNMQNIPKVTE